MGDLILIAGAGAIVAYFLVKARLWPYAPCPACQGRRGRGRGSTPRAYSRCRQCRGSGERIRPLARIYPRWNKEARRRR